MKRPLLEGPFLSFLVELDSRPRLLGKEEKEAEGLEKCLAGLHTGTVPLSADLSTGAFWR